MSRARVYADRNCATNGNLTGSSFFGKLVDSINTVAPASNRIRLHRCLLQLIGGDCGGWNTEPGKGLDLTGSNYQNCPRFPVKHASSLERWMMKIWKNMGGSFVNGITLTKEIRGRNRIQTRFRIIFSRRRPLVFHIHAICSISSPLVAEKKMKGSRSFFCRNQFSHPTLFPRSDKLSTFKSFPLFGLITCFNNVENVGIFRGVCSRVQSDNSALRLERVTIREEREGERRGERKRWRR